MLSISKGFDLGRNNCLSKPFHTNVKDALLDLVADKKLRYLLDLRRRIGEQHNALTCRDQA